MDVSRQIQICVFLEDECQRHWLRLHQNEMWSSLIWLSSFKLINRPRNRFMIQKRKVTPMVETISSDKLSHSHSITISLTVQLSINHFISSTDGCESHFQTFSDQINSTDRFDPPQLNSSTHSLIFWPSPCISKDPDPSSFASLQTFNLFNHSTFQFHEKYVTFSGINDIATWGWGTAVIFCFVVSWWRSRVGNKCIWTNQRYSKGCFCKWISGDKGVFMPSRTDFSVATEFASVNQSCHACQETWLCDIVFADYRGRSCFLSGSQF